MNKVKLIIDFLFDQLILPFLPEGKEEEEEGKENPDGEVDGHS